MEETPKSSSPVNVEEEKRNKSAPTQPSIVDEINKGYDMMRKSFELMAESQKTIISAFLSAYNGDQPQMKRDISQISGDENGIQDKSGKSSKRKRRRRREPGPKKLSGYIVFCAEKRKELKGGGGKDFLKNAGLQWNELSDGSKDVYNQKAKKINEKAVIDFEASKVENQVAEAGSSELVSSLETPKPAEKVSSFKETAQKPKQAEKMGEAPVPKAVNAIDEASNSLPSPRSTPFVEVIKKKKKKHRKKHKKHKKHKHEEVKSN